MRRLLAGWPVAGVVALAFVAVVVVGGCGAFGRQLGHRELVVVFKPDATAGDADRVRAGCGGLPHALAYPPDRNARSSSRHYPVRFDISGIDNGEKSQLYRCLTRDPAVIGASETEPE